MIALIRALFSISGADKAHKAAKLAVTVALLDLLLLVVVETIIVATTHSWLSSTVAVVGLSWTLATAAAIWFKGGVAIDASLIAATLGTKVGDELINALPIFFLAEIGTVGFFFVVPVRAWWPGFFVLPILIVAWILRACKAGIQFD